MVMRYRIYGIFYKIKIWDFLLRSIKYIFFEKEYWLRYIEVKLYDFIVDS